MSKPLTELKNKYLGQDIWIILAGSSMDYVSQDFFKNKIVLGANQVYKHYKCNYIIMKDCMEMPRYTRSIEQLESKNIPLIHSEYFLGDDNKEKNIAKHSNAYYFKHNSKKNSFSYGLENLSDKEIISSKSTVTSIMHIAAYMGAKNIMLCGHDCGRLDGNLYYEGYMEKDWISSENWSGISNRINEIENETLKVRSYLMEKYNCNIHSLNPFLNFSLEEHKFSPC
jgi:hypothetical protein